MNSKLISRGSKKEKKNSKITEDYLRQKGYLFIIIYFCLFFNKQKLNSHNTKNNGG